MHTDLAAWSDRYTQLYSAYEQLTSHSTASSSSAPTQPSPTPTSSSPSSSPPAGREEMEPPSRKLSDTPAVLQEVNGVDFAPAEVRAALPSSPAPDLKGEVEAQRARLYEVEHERDRLRDEVDALRYRVAELKDVQAQLEQAQQTLQQLQVEREKGESTGGHGGADASTSPHLLHLTLLQQEMAQVQAAVDERDRFITLTLTRIDAYKKDREDWKKKEEERKEREKAKDKDSGGTGLVGKLWGGGGKKREKGPEDDDSMEWNGREWVKKAEDDAVSNLLPLPAKPRPLPPTTLPPDLPSLSLDDVLQRIGAKASPPTSSSSSTSSSSLLRSSPAAVASLLLPTSRPSNAYSAGGVKAKTVSARYASSFDDFGFEGGQGGKLSTPSASPTMAAVLSPLPPDADLSASVFTPSAAPPHLPPSSSSSSTYSPSDDPRMQGRSLAQVLDELDAARTSIADLTQQLAMTSSLPRPLPSPSPEQQPPAEMELGHLRGLIRSMEHDKVQYEMALAAEKEQVQALQERISTMKQIESGLIEGHAGEELHDDVDPTTDESTLDSTALLLRLRNLRRKHHKLHAQLHLARQHLRQLEQDRERSGQVRGVGVGVGGEGGEEERRRREVETAAYQREVDGLTRERDGLREERDELLYRLQELTRGGGELGVGGSTPSKALVHRGEGGDAGEMQRLREVVRELERSLSAREEKEGGGAQRAARGSGGGGVVTAEVRVSGFFVISFLMILAALLAAQQVKPDWMGLASGLGGGGSQGAMGGGGSAGAGGGFSS